MKVVEQANQNKKWKNKQQNFTEVSESGTLKPYKGGSIQAGMLNKYKMGINLLLGVAGLDLENVNVLNVENHIATHQLLY